MHRAEFRIFRGGFLGTAVDRLLGLARANSNYLGIPVLVDRGWTTIFSWEPFPVPARFYPSAIYSLRPLPRRGGKGIRDSKIRDLFLVSEFGSRGMGESREGWRRGTKKPSHGRGEEGRDCKMERT